MELFWFIGLYGMPVLGYLFIVSLLRAVRNIVKNKPYTKELFWSGVTFGTIVWTISLVMILSFGD
ncbi:hypothetical protein [Paenibacillus kobensis]|uniref:hypothetical protein n=1 Tax=Paenibacillus kobensis TaxID=59841 RepID=UPI000FDB875E|nr:hypothetical protein [Paenibacillus kobensis]